MNITTHRRTTRMLAAIAAPTAAVALAMAPAASATPAPRVLSDTALAPFQLAVSQQRVWVADGFTGAITRYDPQGRVSTVATDIPGLAGIDVTANGKTYAYTWSNDDHTAGGLTVRSRGKATVNADIAAYEDTVNPDHVNTYGIVGNSNPCAVEILKNFTGGEATYTGAKDIHPYSVARAGARWVVADAGANALLWVSDSGAVSTLAVLPPQPTTITAAAATTFEHMAGAPAGAFSCLVGVDYAFEPVPTDVEVAPDGMLWVTTLPGGPEDDSLGARGSVYRVNPASGSATLVKSGFLGATNLAVHPDGTVYVTELFGGRISKLRHGVVSTVHEMARPLSVEVKGGSLYVGQMADLEFGPEGPVVNGPGSVQVLPR